MKRQRGRDRGVKWNFCLCACLFFDWNWYFYLNFILYFIIFFFILFLLFFLFNFPLGEPYKGEGQMQRDWEMNEIGVNIMKFPKNQFLKIKWKERCCALYLRFLMSSTAQILDDHWSTFWLYRLAYVEQRWWRKSGISVLPKKIPHAQHREEWQAFWEQDCPLVQATSFQALYISFCLCYNALIKKWVSGRLLLASFMLVNSPPTTPFTLPPIPV